jgi:hypothetical protein
MLLAGEDSEHDVKVLHVSISEPGDSVFIEGVEPQEKEITYDEFLKAPIEVKDGKVVSEGKELRTKKEKVKIEKIKEGKVR